MSVRYETRFKYDSTNPKYFGTVLSLVGLKADVVGRTTGTALQSFKVVAQQPFQGIYTLDKPQGSGHGPTSEVPGRTSVEGSFWAALKFGIDWTEFLPEMPPWDVYIAGYSPPEDAAYVAKVLGIQIVAVVPQQNIYTCDFVAAGYVPWEKVI